MHAAMVHEHVPTRPTGAPPRLALPVEAVSLEGMKARSGAQSSPPALHRRETSVFFFRVGTVRPSTLVACNGLCRPTSDLAASTTPCEPPRIFYGGRRRQARSLAVGRAAADPTWPDRAHRGRPCDLVAAGRGDQVVTVVRRPQSGRPGPTLAAHGATVPSWPSQGDPENTADGRVTCAPPQSFCISRGAATLVDSPTAKPDLPVSTRAPWPVAHGTSSIMFAPVAVPPAA